MSRTTSEASFFMVWRKRALWLAAVFIAEMFTFNAMAYFDDAIKAVTVLALFVPLCISVGGNSGSQAARAHYPGDGSASGRPTRLVSGRSPQLLMGFVLGLTLGLCAGAGAGCSRPATS